MSDKPVRKVHQGEVLPPENASPLRELPPATPLGIPLLARAKYGALTKALHVYTEFRQAQRALIDTETGLMDSAGYLLVAEERMAVALKRSQFLDLILELEEAKLLSELDDGFEALAGKQLAKSDKVLERRIRLATLEAEALEAEARVERIRNRPSASDTAGQSRAQRVIAETRRVRKDCEELREEIIRAAGGEANLSEEDRAFLDTIALWAENELHNIMEGL